ncbi:MAG: histidine kinase [Aeromicrobium sp.]
MQPLWPRLTDCAIAGAVLLIGIAEIWVPFTSREAEGSTWISTVQVAVVAGALLVRRTRPLVCSLVIFVAFVALHAAGVVYLLFFGQFVPMLLATFAVARHAEGRARYVGGGLLAATLLTGDLLVDELQDMSEIVFHWGVLTIAFSLGAWQRVMADREAASRRRAIDIEVEAAAQAASAVAAERTRVARELHDVVAHAMSVIVVQAGATTLVADEPDQVRRALETIRKTGADALNEMRRLVTMLRDPEDVALRDPQPGLGGVEALVNDARARGLPVSLSMSGVPRDLPAGLDLAAYRVVQEALTNTQRHARDLTWVSVSVELSDHELRLGVRDDGAASRTPRGSGHGLIGMRERVALYQGEMRAEALPDRGFVVEAVLPLEPV